MWTAVDLEHHRLCFRVNHGVKEQTVIRHHCFQLIQSTEHQPETPETTLYPVIRLIYTRGRVAPPGQGGAGSVGSLISAFYIYILVYLHL